jgi:hypothetical protein
MKKDLRKLTNKYTTKVITFIENGIARKLTAAEVTIVSGILVAINEPKVGTKKFTDFELLFTAVPAHSGLFKVRFELHYSGKYIDFLEFLC